MPDHGKHMPNKPDAANPAIALWLAIEDQWRRVADLERTTSTRNRNIAPVRRTAKGRPPGLCCRTPAR
jgi:hypothetical protein